MDLFLNYISLTSCPHHQEFFFFLLIAATPIIPEREIAAASIHLSVPSLSRVSGVDFFTLTSSTFTGGFKFSEGSGPFV